MITSFLSFCRRFCLPSSVAVSLLAPLTVFAEADDAWKHGELSAWQNNVSENWRMAHALGYRSVAHYRHEDERTPWRRDLMFFLADPHKSVQPYVTGDFTHGEVEMLKRRYPYTFSEFPELPRAIHEEELRRMKKNNQRAYEDIKASFERNKAWSHPGREFPSNLAQLQTWGTDGIRWEPCPDFQQQRVIDETIANIIRYAKGQAEVEEDNFLFKGFVIDVPEIWEEFNWNSARGLPGEPAEMRYALPHNGVTHEYTTLREGWLQFLAQLNTRGNEEFPGRDVKIILEPTPLYSPWVAKLKNVTEPSLTPEVIELARGDFLVQEKPGLNFLENEKLFEDGWWDLRSVGSATPDIFPNNPFYPSYLKYFGEIAARGSWFITFGTFARGRDEMAAYEPQFKLMRALSGWENLHETSLDERIWDDEQQIYFSPTAWATEDAVAGLHLDNGMIYGVLLSPEGYLPLADGVEITDVYGVNDVWEIAESMDKAQLANAPESAYPIAFAAKFTGAERPFAQPEGLELTESLTPENLIVSKLYDPSFEEGGTGWHCYDADVELVVVDDIVFDGKKSMWVKDRKMRWHGLNQDITGFLMANMMGTYEVSLMIRATKPGQVFGVRINMMEHGEKFEFVTEPIDGEVNEWVQLKALIEIDWEDALDSGTLNIREIGGGMDDFYVDNVEFTKIN